MVLFIISCIAIIHWWFVLNFMFKKEKSEEKKPKVPLEPLIPKIIKQLVKDWWK